MTQISQKIVFFGTETYSVGALQALIDGVFDVALVITKPDSRSGRGMKLSAPPVKVVAEKHDIPVLQPQKVSEIIDHVSTLQPATGVLVAYGKIIPQAVLDLFSPGIINIHPSLLPLYRGPSPIEAAMVNRDQQTGVTLMKLEAGMDSGPIYTQETIELTGNETKKDLYERLFGLGEKMLVEKLPQIINGTLLPAEQDHNQATYCSLLSKDDSRLDPTKLTAAEAEARVRAYLGFPKTKISLGDKDIIVTGAHASNTAEHKLSIKFIDDKYLTVDEVLAPSGKTMPAEAFIRGYLKD